MSKRELKKSRWFTLGRQALVAVRPGAPSVYCCPLCLWGYDDQSVLTFEDVPPKSVGGRRLVLTCHRCNQHSGSKLDPHARLGQDAREFAAGTRNLDVRITVGGDFEIGATMRRTADGFLFLGERKRSNPDHHDAFFERLENISRSGSLDWRFGVNVRMKKHDPWGEYLSWLRAAYLIAFASLGYTYILRPELNMLREQLMNPKQRILPFLLSEDANADTAARKLMIVYEPAALRSVLVQFGQRLVFLPDFTATGSIPERLRGETFNQGETQISGCEFPWPTSPQLLVDFNPSLLRNCFPPGHWREVS